MTLITNFSNAIGDINTELSGIKCTTKENFKNIIQSQLHGQSYQTLCDPMDCSLQGSSLHGIFQARILELVAISSSRVSPDPGIKHASLRSPELAGGFFTTEPSRKPQNLLNINLMLCSYYVRARAHTHTHTHTHTI